MSWVDNVPLSDFQELGDVKLLKLVDYLSTLYTFTEVREGHRYAIREALIVKKQYASSLLSELSSNRKLASREYCRDKVIIDSETSWAITEESLADVYAELFREKAKADKAAKKKTKKKRDKDTATTMLPSNVIPFKKKAS